MRKPFGRRQRRHVSVTGSNPNYLQNAKPQVRTKIAHPWVRGGLGGDRDMSPLSPSGKPSCPTCGGTPELDPMVASWSPDRIAHVGACPDRHPPTAWGDWYRHLEAQGATP